MSREGGKKIRCSWAAASHADCPVRVSDTLWFVRGFGSESEESLYEYIICQFMSNAIVLHRTCRVQKKKECMRACKQTKWENKSGEKKKSLDRKMNRFTCQCWWESKERNSGDFYSPCQQIMPSVRRWGLTVFLYFNLGYYPVCWQDGKQNTQKTQVE